MSAAAAPAPLKRIQTVLYSVEYWLTVSTEESNTILLTTNPTEASSVQFESTTDDKEVGVDGTTPHYITFSTTEGPVRLRPSLSTAAHGVSLEGVTLTTTPHATWIRTAVSDPDVDTTEWSPSYKIALAGSTRLVSAFNSTVILTDPAVVPALTFTTETLCTDCGFCWTSHNSNNCSFCRAQADTTSYMVANGKPPEFPCNCCGTPTPYGGYCSQACEWDTEGCPRGRD